MQSALQNVARIPQIYKIFFQIYKSLVQSRIIMCFSVFIQIYYIVSLSDKFSNHLFRPVYYFSLGNFCLALIYNLFETGCRILLSAADRLHSWVYIYLNIAT